MKKLFLSALFFPLALFGATNQMDNLWVPGNFRYSGGGPAAGSVLTSDAAGNGSWSVASGFGNAFTNKSQVFFAGTVPNYTNHFESYFTMRTFLQFVDIGSAADYFGTMTERWSIRKSGATQALEFNSVAAGIGNALELNWLTGMATVTNLTVLGNITAGSGSGNTLTFNGATATTPNGLSWNSGQWNLRTTGNNSMSGKLSIGSDINPISGILQLGGIWTNFHGFADSGTYTRTSGNIQHINISPTINADGSAIATVLRIAPTFNAVSNMTNIQQINLAPTLGTGTAGLTNFVITGRAINVGAVQGTGTIIFGSYYGAQINDPTFTSNIISNNFGVHIEQRTIGLTSRANLVIGGVPTSGNWGIYNASSYSNYVASPLFLGTLTAGNAISSVYSATASLDFGNILAASSADLTITVTGAAVGDAVIHGPPAAPNADITFDAFVSAANTVTIRSHNVGAVAVDQAAETHRATVIHH